MVEKKGTCHAQSILDEVSAWSTNNKVQLHPLWMPGTKDNPSTFSDKS